MNKADAISILRKMVNEETEKNKSRDPNSYLENYYHGRIEGMKTALFFLGEKQAVREHEKTMKAIREEKIE